MSDANKGTPTTAVQAVEASLRRGDRGRVDVHARDRDDLVELMRRAKAGGCDATVVINGLTATTLAFVSQSICDFVVDEDVPVVFGHRGRFLQLQVVELPSAE